MTDPYIFCIGFNKCATQALNLFFQRNNIPSVHFDGGRLAKTMVTNLLEGRKILSGYDHKFRAFSDMNFLNYQIAVEGNSFFRTMDRDYPESLFIYHTREIDAWVQSRSHHKSGDYIERYMSASNAKVGNKVFEYWKRQRMTFESEIEEYFAGSPRLLILDVDTADVARLLANFLGLDFQPHTWSKVHVTPEPRKRAPDRV